MARHIATNETPWTRAGSSGQGASTAARLMRAGLGLTLTAALTFGAGASAYGDDGSSSDPLGGTGSSTPTTPTVPVAADGNRSTGCDVNWYAKTEMNQQFSSGDVHYSNTGYIFKRMKPAEKKDTTGVFELQHWISGNTIFWRLPLATKEPIYDAKITIDLAQFNPEGETGNYFNYAVTPGTYDYVADDRVGLKDIFKKKVDVPAAKIAQDGTVVTISLGDLAAGTRSPGVMIVGTIPAQMDAAKDSFFLDATLTGKYAEGSDTCTATVPSFTAPKAANVCEAVTSGRALARFGASDIIARPKYDAAGNPITGSDFKAEVNADGWWAGKNFNFRLYGATREALNDVTATFTAAQGFTFDSPASFTIYTGNYPGTSKMGMLDDNGFINPIAAEDLGTPVVSEDGKTITLQIARMPANSAFAFSVQGVPDGSLKQLEMHGTLMGDVDGCVVPPPTPSTPPAADTPDVEEEDSAEEGTADEGSETTDDSTESGGSEDADEEGTESETPDTEGTEGEESGGTEDTEGTKPAEPTGHSTQAVVKKAVPDMPQGTLAKTGADDVAGTGVLAAASAALGAAFLLLRRRGERAEG